MAIFTLSELGWQSYMKMAGYFTWCWLSELRSSCLRGSTLSTEPFTQPCCIDFNKYFFILSLAIQWIERIENYCDLQFTIEEIHLGVWSIVIQVIRSISGKLEMGPKPAWLLLKYSEEYLTFFFLRLKKNVQWFCIASPHKWVCALHNPPPCDYFGCTSYTLCIWFQNIRLE